MKFFLTVLLFLSTISVAAIYVEKDLNGNTVYSDTPSSNKSVELNAPVSISSVPSAPIQTNTTQVKKAAAVGEVNENYKTFLISTPKDQESIQNQPSFTVTFTLDPPLRAGDVIQLYVDGKPWQHPETSTNITVNELERGTHQLSGIIIDSNKNTLKQSNNVTIYVHRVGLNRPPTN